MCNIHYLLNLFPLDNVNVFAPVNTNLFIYCCVKVQSLVFAVDRPPAFEKERLRQLLVTVPEAPPDPVTVDTAANLITSTSF